MAFPYSSKHIPSVDDAVVKGRLFLYIPSKEKDIFAQYAVGKGKQDKLPNAISVITVVKEEAGKPLPVPLVYYNDIWRTRGAKIEVANRIDSNRRMENCYSCHKSALIPVYPDEGEFNFKKFGERLTRANNIMSQYGSAKYFGIEEMNFGPAMGIPQLKSCAKAAGIKPELNQDFNCADCHNGRERGVLNFPTGLDLQLPGNTSLMKLFVKDYSIMPPMHQDMTEKERASVFECLVEDYYGDFESPNKGILNKWLLQESCG